MHYLQLIRTNSNDLRSFQCETGTIFLCEDNLKLYIDRDNVSNRVDITQSCVLCENEHEFSYLGSYTKNRLYICKTENKFYLTKEDAVPQQVTLYSELIGTVLESPNLIKTKAIRQAGTYIAPITTTASIYDSEGNSMTEALEYTRQDVRRQNKVKEQTMECYEEGQTIFTIPFPSYDYQITTSNFFVAINDTLKNPSDYVINDTKIIFNEGLSQGDIIKFIFHYNIVSSINKVENGTVGLSSLTKELRDMIESMGDISDITFPDGSNLSTKIAEILNAIKGTSGDGIKDSIVTVYNLVDLTRTEQTENDNQIKSLVEELKTRIDTLEERLDQIESNTNGLTSMSAIKKVIRGNAEIPHNQETAEVEIGEIVDPNKISITIQGDSYYNETPYVYQVFEDRFIVRQKSLNVTPDYSSIFSWEIIVYV